MSTSATYFL